MFCSTEPELKQWLYHLEKQIHLNGGSLGLPLVAQVGAWGWDAWAQCWVDAVLCSVLPLHHLLQPLGLGLGKFSLKIRSLLSISKGTAHLCSAPSLG